VLKDNAGNVRARLSMQNGVGGGAQPEMDLLDTEGKTNLELMGASKLSRGTVWILDEHGVVDAALSADSDGGKIAVLGSEGNKGTGVWLGRGNLNITDAEGFETSVGVEDLVTPKTGESHKTSAASVVLFDKNKKVIWQAP